MVDNFRLIKTYVSAPEVWRLYGNSPIINNLVNCIHHSDTHPSMRLYAGSRGYYCFACNEGGDVIKLTSTLLGLSPYAALCRLSKDFYVPLSLSNTSLDDQVQSKRRSYAKHEAHINNTRIVLSKYHRMLFHAKSDPNDPLFAESLSDLDKVAWLLDELDIDPDSILSGWQLYIQRVSKSLIT